jgi:hypothetical protein
MALLGPNSEDVAKLHAEVNQIVNQRFLLTTLGITILGIVGGWLFMKHETLMEEGQIGGIVYAVSALLLALLFMLFYFGQMLYGKLRIYTSYLYVTKGSNWEQDWKEFREGRKYIGYRKAQSFVYLLLGVAAFIVPLAFAIVMDLSLTPWAGFAALCVLFVLYAIFVAGMGLAFWFDPEEAAINQWQVLNL